MIKGIIFDMDGVISDTQKLHSLVECELLNRHSIDITPEEITGKYAGVRTKEFFDVLLGRCGQEYDLEELIKEKWIKMEKLADESVDEMPGSIELIKMFHKKGIPLAVASASNLKYVRSVLGTLKVADYFHSVFGGDMVSKGKPDPEIFLLAASKINIRPENCLVVEDGVSGMIAAKSANMKCIGLVQDRNKEYPTKNLIASLSEITFDYLEKIY